MIGPLCPVNPPDLLGTPKLDDCLDAHGDVRFEGDTALRRFGTPGLEPYASGYVDLPKVFIAGKPALITSSSLTRVLALFLFHDGAVLCYFVNDTDIVNDQGTCQIVIETRDGTQAETYSWHLLKLAVFQVIQECVARDNEPSKGGLLYELGTNRRAGSSPKLSPYPQQSLNHQFFRSNFTQGILEA